MKDEIWEENEYTTPPKTSEIVTEKSQENTTNVIGKEFAYGEWNDIGKVSGIYKIVNRVNGKYYVGSSKNITNRWNKHVVALIKGVHHSPILQRAWNKYGQSSFYFKVVELVTDSRMFLLESEQSYLNGIRTNMYNASFNAIGGTLLPETIIKIKKTWTVEKRKEHSDKMIGNKNHFYGKSHNSEVKSLISELHRGKSLSTDHKSKISKSTSGSLNHFFGKDHNESTKKVMSQKNSRKGLDNGRADKRIYSFFNKNTGQTFIGDRCSFGVKSGVKSIYDLISGKVKCNKKTGWMLTPNFNEI